MMDVLEAKDPADVLDYGFDWSAALASVGGDTIATATWSAEPAGLTLSGAGGSGAVRTTFVSGGTAGTTYTLTCRITTIGLRTLERSATIFCTER